jgi:hypothetical protein
MGLDQYAYRTKIKPKKPVDFERDEDSIEIFYWRKHPDLQGWMQKLYRAKGGADESFNSSPVVLTMEDLDNLENDVRQHKLPETQGFFFGKSYGEEMERDLDFIDQARRAIKDGYTVYYSSWW